MLVRTRFRFFYIKFDYTLKIEKFDTLKTTYIQVYHWHDYITRREKNLPYLPNPSLPYTHIPSKTLIPHSTKPPRGASTFPSKINIDSNNNWLKTPNTYYFQQPRRFYGGREQSTLCHTWHLCDQIRALKKERRKNQPLNIFQVQISEVWHHCQGMSRQEHSTSTIILW